MVALGGHSCAMRVGKWKRLGLLAAGAAVAVSLAAPAESTAVTFGANLARTPANVETCNELSAATLFPPGQTFGSCSLIFNDISSGESVFPPAGRGVITQARVRVGPSTGPMQVIVEQALRKDNPASPGTPTYACCQAMAASQVFTPTPNTITAVNMRLPVRQDLSPDPSTGIYTDQHLALSILAGNVQLPAAAVPGDSAFLGVWFPAWQVGQERVGPPPSYPQFIGLLSADWVNCPAAKSASTAKKKKKKKNACGKKKKKKKGKKSTAVARANAAALRDYYSGSRVPAGVLGAS
jgi:hypothetical protein